MRLNITLYKNCILNKSYNQTFSFGSVDGAPTSVLELYLAMLENFNFDVNDVYYENSGELIFALEILIGSQRNNIYKYNYVRFVLYDNNNREILRRYCFVNSISVKNECVYLNYEEDIWHSYGSKIKGILPSYLSRSRVKEYNEKQLSVVCLPRKFDGNNKLKYHSIFVNEGEFVSRDCYLWVEIQLYEIVQGISDKVIRSSYFYLIKSYTDIFTLKINNCYSICERLISQMPSMQIDGKNFQIGKIFIIPAYFTDNINYLLSNTIYTITLPPVGTSSAMTIYLQRIDQVSVALDNGVEIKQGTISNNYKNVAIGTFDNFIEIENNGTDIPYSIIMTRTNSYLNFKLNILNKVIDITGSFSYEPPLTAILAEDFSQRKIAIELEKNSLARASKNASWSTFSSFDQSNTDLGNIILSAVLSKRKQGTWESGGAFRQDLFSMVSSIQDQFFIHDRQKLITSPIYSNSKANITNVSNIINYTGGIFIFYIEPDNKEFIKNFVNIFGYEVFEFIFDLDEILFKDSTYWGQNHINYNVIKFDTINVYGEFTDEIAEKLNSILMNGIRIWYEPTMTEDTYNDDLLN